MWNWIKHNIAEIGFPLLENLDHYILRHRIYRVCCFIGDSAWFERHSEAFDSTYDEYFGISDGE